MEGFTSSPTQRDLRPSSAEQHFAEDIIAAQALGPKPQERDFHDGIEIVKCEPITLSYEEQRTLGHLWDIQRHPNPDYLFTDQPQQRPGPVIDGWYDP